MLARSVHAFHGSDELDDNYAKYIVRTGVIHIIVAMGNELCTYWARNPSRISIITLINATMRSLKKKKKNKLKDKKKTEEN